MQKDSKSYDNLEIILVWLNKNDNPKEKIKEIKKIYPNSKISLIINDAKYTQKDDVCYLFGENVNEDGALSYVLHRLKLRQIIVIRNDYNWANNLEKFKKPMLFNHNVASFGMQTKSKFKNFFLKLFNWLSLKILGYTFWQGNPNVMYFGEQITEVLVELNNPSAYIKMNCWRGIRETIIEEDVPKRKHYFSWPAFLTVLFSFLLAISGIVCLVVFGGQMKSVLVIALVALIFFITILAFIFLVRFLSICRIGQLQFRACEPIEKGE